MLLATCSGAPFAVRRETSSSCSMALENPLSQLSLAMSCRAWFSSKGLSVCSRLPVDRLRLLMTRCECGIRPSSSSWYTMTTWKSPKNRMAHTPASSRRTGRSMRQSTASAITEGCFRLGGASRAAHALMSGKGVGADG